MIRWINTIDVSSVEYLRKHGFSVAYVLETDHIKLCIYYNKKHIITVHENSLAEICDFVEVL